MGKYLIWCLVNYDEVASSSMVPGMLWYLYDTKQTVINHNVHWEQDKHEVSAVSSKSWYMDRNKRNTGHIPEKQYSILRWILLANKLAAVLAFINKQNLKSISWWLI